MHLLLDTHCFLWWLENNPKLSQEHKRLIQDTNHLVFVSDVVIWEIILKQQAGKLEVFDNLEGVVEQCEFEALPIKKAHMLRVRELPLIHKDPHDRLLVAQAQVEGMHLVTQDKMLDKYF